MTTIVSTVTDLIKDSVESSGFDLWGVEFISNRYPILRVYIDHAENGVNIEDCATISRLISSILDVEDPIPQEYNLEVSSPGMERPIFTLQQYKKYLNHFVTIHLRIAQENSRRFTGKLIAINDNNDLLIALKKDGLKKAKSNLNSENNQAEQIIEIAFSNITRGNLTQHKI